MAALSPERAVLEDAVADLVVAASRGTLRASPPPWAHAMAGTRFARRCRAAAEESRRGLQAQEWARGDGSALAEDGTARHGFGAGRGGVTGRAHIDTVASHVRATETMRKWLVRARCPVARDDRAYINYVRARDGEPCGQTVPNQPLRAMVWTERVAGAVVANAEMPLRVGSAFAGVLEQLLIDEDLARYMRGLAWPRLVKMLAVLRYDDHSMLPPRRLAIVDGKLIATLRRTRTSRAGRTMPELPLVVSRACYVLAQRGHRPAMQDVVRKPAGYAEAAAACQEVLQRMLKPAAYTGVRIR
ncbi:unnamed protein product [Prorocentrum cordatum]|uniref:RNA-directed RNA polymerase n=1 Tax=Prorocentrum cordatum TaxID=2364126 RepID=A0ABN9VKP2_9DINO|nr:unnamed protein product [Polarella glacialis]